MQLTEVQRVLGILLMIFSGTLLPPVAVSSFCQDGAATAFLVAFGLTLVVGWVCWYPVRDHIRELKLRDGFLVVVVFWTVLGLTGALPFMLAHHPHMSLTDSVFESISGLTTTGATVIVGLDEMPRSILYYRQQLQWLGGMGIIVLAVAVLPMLGIGGMQLYRAETPGPIKDTKLTPRITETAKALWFIYLGLTVFCLLAYWAAGMTLFDAVCHAFSTISIGGFSTHDASIGYFDSTLIELIAVFFLLLSGANFALHFSVLRRRRPMSYFYDTEFRYYLGVLAIASLAAIVALYESGIYESWDKTIVRGIFQAVSIGTTTGFTSADYAAWPGFILIFLLWVSFIGGCAGSTGGGIKVIRFLLLIKQGLREIRRLIHPNAKIPIRVGRRPVASRVVEAVWGFFALYVACFTCMYMALMVTGVDTMSAFSAVAACINNLGPGLGAVASNYVGLNDPAKWILCFAMLLGRLEVFTLLVLLAPDYWRR